MATSTVEDYLKAIFHEEQRSRSALVPTGRIATAMGVAPGTVTAMMKALTDSGLVGYEPYAGVQLTPAGRSLAAHVLRRHRLVELFLVRVMGMDWSEVHEQAEVLEHAVSDRLIERMDQMLGHPAVDPHGDPIPTACGNIEEPDLPSLLSCQAGAAVRIARVTDQRAEFLQLLEQHGLMPGRSVVVEAHDQLAETIGVRSDGGVPFQLGFPAASRILVESEGPESRS